MIEVLFGESEAGSMKCAKSRKSLCRSEVFAVDSINLNILKVYATNGINFRDNYMDTQRRKPH